MKELASESDLRQYCRKFKSIFGRILRPGVDFNTLAIVSTVEGALLFFTFKKQKREEFRYKLIDAPISTALQDLPQRGIRGDLSGVRFAGKNVIFGRNRLIIIKGDNTQTAWSLKEAVKDAIEEVQRAARMHER